MKNFLILFSSILLAACGSTDHRTERVVQESHILELLNDDDFQERLTNAEKDLQFWLNKSNNTPRGYVYLQKAANATLELFDITGQMEYLELNKELLIEANLVVQGKNRVNNLLGISHAEMMLHNFKLALNYSLKADSLAEQKFGSLMMQYDAAMELGSYQWADQLLDRARRPGSFDYLVRLAKYKDHMGQLDSAIYYNEEALKVAESPEKRNWVTTNLADLYGHAGFINKSFNQYLKAISYDPNDYHAIKGIIWIAFSNDKNYALAERLCKQLIQKTSNPEYLLLLADIYEAMGKSDQAEMHRNSFINRANSSMYSSHLIPLFAEYESQEAVALALSEVQKRPTPQIFSLLAWAYLKNGEQEKAVEVIENHVYQQTFEPMAIYRMAVIFRAANDSRSDALTMELLNAEFELGPVILDKIKNQLG